MHSVCPFSPKIYGLSGTAKQNPSRFLSGNREKTSIGQDNAYLPNLHSVSNLPPASPNQENNEFRKGKNAMMAQNRLSTEELLSMLFEVPNFHMFLDETESELSVPAFHDYITALCTRQKEVPEHIIQRSGLEKSFGHQLFSGRRSPSRDSVLQLAFGFSLSVTETQELLRIAGKSPLYPRVKRDAAILYCLYHDIPLIDAQIILYDLDLPVLGGGRKND